MSNLAAERHKCGLDRSAGWHFIVINILQYPFLPVLFFQSANLPPSDCAYTSIIIAYHFYGLLYLQSDLRWNIQPLILLVIHVPLCISKVPTCQPQMEYISPRIIDYLSCDLLYLQSADLPNYLLPLVYIHYQF